jgi:hypothetical protein
MNRIRTVVGVLTLALLFSGILAGQDKKATDKKATDKKAGDKKPSKSKGTLPAYYGKLNLKDDQKQKVLAIKADYGPRIKALAKQLVDLRKKQKAEFEKVLTADQKSKLHDMEAARKKGKKTPASKDKKKKPRKKKKDSKGSKDKKTDSTAQTDK